MNLQSLKFSHFRNYQEASFSFEPGAIHVFYGRNAQGKTNILEAIYYLSHLRSFRTSRIRQMISHGQESLSVEGIVEKNGHETRLSALVDQAGRSQGIFGSPSKAGQFIGQLNAILFCPDDISLFTDGPGQRRSFMDMELVKLSKSYTSALSRYQKLLRSRNQALKEYPVNRYLIDALSDQMTEIESVIIFQRHAFIKELNQLTGKILKDFGEDEVLEIVYRSPVDPEKDIKLQLRELYQKSRDRDIRMKNTSVGIHKDDLDFILNGYPVLQHASQGQKRTILYALKLGLAQMIQKKSGQFPVFLLDDVFSELDPFRKKAFIRQLPENMQIFISTAEPVSPSWFDRETKFYTVQNGTVEEGLNYE